MYSIEQEHAHQQMRQASMENLQQPYQTPETQSVQQQMSDMSGKGAVEYEGRIYSLEVVQQPIRARMCGFGDKDRRPITPPPCVRLIVRDATTKEEIDPSDIDTSFFVLTVDLWSADASYEVNLVRHSASSPSISTASASSFPPPPTVSTPYAYGQSGYPQGSAYANFYNSPGYNQQGMQYGGNTGSPYYGINSPYYPPGGAPIPHVQTSPVGMFTRNLIGSLSASAFQLTDPENRLGIWFILQDLSVRTEGAFRLKMNFVNVGTQALAATPGENPPPPQLITQSAPILASVFSDVFHVFSAKKFPGVIESTPLSKCFAIQGIKIPIRKDGVKGQRMVPPPMPQQGPPPARQQQQQPPAHEGGEHEEWEE